MRDVETALDEALAQTFPASDPIACTPKSVAELRVLGRASQGAPRAALRTSGREQRRVEGSADAGAERAARADGATALAVLDAKRGNAPGAGSPVPIEAESPWATTERPEPAALRQVRALERIRIEAIRRNDVNAMLRLLDPLFICITDCGDLFDRDSYIGAVRSHQLSYDTDLELTRPIIALTATS